MAPRGQLVFSVGLGALVFVPFFKALTGLPPYMGILLGLGILWILTDAIHYGESERQRLKVPQALSRIDTQGALFFLGILMSVKRYKDETLTLYFYSLYLFPAKLITVNMLFVVYKRKLHREYHMNIIFSSQLGCVVA